MWGSAQKVGPHAPETMEEVKQLPYPDTNQKRTGFMKETSSNKERRTGRSDGTRGGQPKTGTLGELSRPTGRKGSGDYGMGGGQKKTGVSAENSTNPGGHSQSGRMDEIQEISN